jgi:hypothetical protein
LLFSLPFPLLGYGKASSNPFPSFPRGLAIEFIASHLSLFRAPLGFPAFPPSLLPFPLGFLNLSPTFWFLTSFALILFSQLQLGIFPYFVISLMKLPLERS